MTAVVATFFCLALRIGPPGAFFFVLVHGVGGLAAGGGAPATTIVAAVAVGALVAVVVGMSDLLLDPEGPQRRAVEAAEAAMARFEHETDRSLLARSRAESSAALHAGWVAVTDAGRPVSWAARMWAVQERYVAVTARVSGGDLGLDPAPWGDPDGPGSGPTPAQARPAGDRSPAEDRRVDAEQIRDTSLGRPSATALVRRAARWPSEILLVVARVAVAALVAGALAGGLGVPHVYWAVAFAVLVLHQGGTRDAQTVRAIQRLGGTTLGLVLFALLQWAAPSGWALVVVIAALQFVVELLVVRNYGLAVVVITPLALTIGMHAAGRLDPVAMLAERGLDTVVGVAVALGSLWVVGRGTSVVLLRAYARDVVVAVDAVLADLADLAEGRVSTARAREHRRLLYDALLESDRVGRRAATDDPDDVTPYRDMERRLSDLGYLVLGLAWHPEAHGLRDRAARARTPIAGILAHPVPAPRPADDISEHLAAAEDVLRATR